MNIKKKREKNTNLEEHKITMKKLKKQVKGITLIALIVTIIVLLILAAIALDLTIGDNGLFSRAQGARNEWLNSSANEQIAMDEASNFILDYMNGNGGNSGGSSGSLGNITGNEKNNTTTQDKYGNPITIPAGFKVVNPEDDVTKGIIIEDVSAGDHTTKGSQFVWIPIGNIKVDNKGTTVPIELGRYSFDNTQGENCGKEKLEQSAENWEEEVLIGDSNGYLTLETTEETEGRNKVAKNLEQFITSATKYSGYYIGRYELGNSNLQNNELPDESTLYDPVVCKEGIYPFRCSLAGNVVEELQNCLAIKCREMYYNKNFESDLINSYTWDTALVFIQKFSGDTDYSTTPIPEEKISKCGESLLNNERDVRCNIYDMASNGYEYITESNDAVGSGSHYCITARSAGARITMGYSATRGTPTARPILYIIENEKNDIYNPLIDFEIDNNKNVETQDKYGNPITIPAGFKIVNPNDDVTKGIVIEDVGAGDENTKGNQFVWVPIGNIKTDTKGTTEKIELGRYKFSANNGKQEEAELVQPASNWESDSEDRIIDYCYEDTKESEYGNATAKNLEEFINKATERHGYYVGRYQAGDAKATSERTEGASTSNPVVVKEGAYPYTWITQNEASELSKNLYKSQNFESDLINSYAWDTASVYIQKFGRYTLRDENCNIHEMYNLTDYGSRETTYPYRMWNESEYTTETSMSYGSYRGPYVLRKSNSDRDNSVYYDFRRSDYTFRLVLYL